jgi:hypothetical protein
VAGSWRAGCAVASRGGLRSSGGTGGVRWEGMAVIWSSSWVGGWQLDLSGVELLAGSGVI